MFLTDAMLSKIPGPGFNVDAVIIVLVYSCILSLLSVCFVCIWARALWACA